jgi:hypothetical protein
MSLSRSAALWFRDVEVIDDDLGRLRIASSEMP